MFFKNISNFMISASLLVSSAAVFADAPQLTNKDSEIKPSFSKTFFESRETYKASTIGGFLGTAFGCFKAGTKLAANNFLSKTPAGRVARTIWVVADKAITGIATGAALGGTYAVIKHRWTSRSELEQRYAEQLKINQKNKSA